MSRIEALLSARLFLAPQRSGDYLYFVSNLSGRMSLYRMPYGGGVPQPLLPPHIALQNPELMEGPLFSLLPALNSILVMLDQDGNEIYQPMLIPLEGGFPEPFHPEVFGDYKVSAYAPKEAPRPVVYFLCQSRTEPLWISYQCDLIADTLTPIGAYRYGGLPVAQTSDHRRLILMDQYGLGDSVLYQAEVGRPGRELLYGVPLEARRPDTPVPPNGINQIFFSLDEQRLLVQTTLFDDKGGLAWLALDNPTELHPIPIEGVVHSGLGELESVERLRPGRSRVLARYNIDGCSWVYEGTLDEDAPCLRLERVLVGQGTLANGVLEGLDYDPDSDSYALSFCTATSPTQLYTLEGAQRHQVQQHTQERVLGITPTQLAPGEDYSFVSHDGLRISARLYLPAGELGYAPPYPLVYYIHGGPQSQERPNFAWFSMPLIQFLTLKGFAVFVPNVRGSTGYGFDYMNRVVRDWGGQDRLDHVHAMTHVLPDDPRLDLSRAGVIGRSYGGYMTLTLAARHPNLWQAAVDMFGPYDLIQFAGRVPETWKPFIKFLVGDPETERDFLLERSPRTYIHHTTCPLLVIQGKNDPRVWEMESRELVEELRAQGKEVAYLMFDNEGHDVLKFENRVACYNAITHFFHQHLGAAVASPV